jgi:hypothetical protein
MYWNHRLVKGPAGEFTMREVYYDDDGTIIGWTEDPIAPFGNTTEEIIVELDRMSEACHKPVLQESELLSDI